MKTRLMTLVVIMAVSMSSFGLMAQNTPDAPARNVLNRDLHRNR